VGLGPTPQSEALRSGFGTWRPADLLRAEGRRYPLGIALLTGLYYGAARRLLRDKIAAYDIHFAGKSLDLGMHDERDDV